MPSGIEEFIHSHSTDVVNCPHCGRYVGPLELCVYCRRFHAKRLCTRIVKYVSPLLAIVALGALYGLGEWQGHPSKAIKEISEKNNYAYIRFAGTVCKAPSMYDSEEGGGKTLSFCVDDKSGMLEVKAYAHSTGRMAAAGQIPASGDFVEILANLTIRGDDKSVIINSPDQISVRRSEAEQVLDASALAALKPGLDPGQIRRNAIITMSGTVVYVSAERQPGQYSVFLRLRGKGEGAVGVSIPWDRLESEGAVAAGDHVWAGAPGIGAEVSVTGALRYKEPKVEKGKRKGGWTVDVGHVGDIAPISGGSPQEANRE